MFLVTHRATGVLAALLIAAAGAISLGSSTAMDCPPSDPPAVAATLASASP